MPFESISKGVISAKSEKRGVYMSGMKEMRNRMRGSLRIKDYKSS